MTIAERVLEFGKAAFLAGALAAPYAVNGQQTSPSLYNEKKPMLLKGEADKNPKDAYARYLLGVAYLASGKDCEGREELKKALQLTDATNPNDKWMLEMIRQEQKSADIVGKCDLK